MHAKLYISNITQCPGCAGAHFSGTRIIFSLSFHIGLKIPE